MIVAMERKLISELIDEYKTCTCLWRIKDPDYKNKEMKNEAYESLLQLIKKYNESCTMDDLKRKIANLRTCYLREFKKVMDAKRYGGIYEPSLWYYKSLEFLNDQHHSEDRVRLGRSYPDNSDEDNESNETQNILVYEDADDRAASEDKDSCSTDPEYQQSCTAVNSNLQTVLNGIGGGSGGSGGGGGSGDGVKRPKRRRRLLDVSAVQNGPSARPSQPQQPPDRYSGGAGAADFYEPQILGGVGGDPSELPVADYYDGFGRYAANELRQMDRQSVIIAKRLVNEVLFLGQMGMLNVNTRIETPTTGRRKNASASAGCKSETRNRRHRRRQHRDEDDDDEDDDAIDDGDEHGGSGGGLESPMPPVEFMETS
ncbi:MADF domain-containing protein [Aphis craccivora]|uniref:MADF domain-containing protein n=1 Tax=Aphis craccivora TaxID=307492 RepID=A0A6G0YUZ8_APHCR|nr:MADF domain-containing protein [Aphis craccivora]